MKRYLKKIVCLALALLLLMSLTSCGNQKGGSDEKTPAPASDADQSASEPQQPEETGEQTPDETQEETGQSGSGILVIYFSRTGEQYTVGVIDKGNTAIVAEMIAEQTGADMFEVLPADDRYPMTYNELTDVAKQEQNQKARPEYTGELPDLSGYDTVFIGAPVW